MRRPAAVCAAGFTAGIAVCEEAGGYSFLLSAAGFLLLFLLNKCKNIEKNKINVIREGEKIPDGGLEYKMSGRFRRDFLYFFPLMKKTAVVFLLFFAAGSLRYSWFDADVSAFAGRSGESAELTGRIVSEEVREDRRVFEIRVRNEDGSGGERILVTVKNPFFERKERSQTENKPEKGSGENASPGRTEAGRRAERTAEEEGEIRTGCLVAVRGVLREPESSGNPGTFDYRRYLKSRGIRMTMQAEESGFTLKGEPRGVYLLLNRLALFQRIYLSAASEVMGEEGAGLLAGILFGDRTKMDEKIYEDFQKNGTAHLLAVSGLHISLIYSVLSAASGNPATMAGNLPAAVILILYAALSGFSPSVVRAVFMILIHIAAKISHRRYDGLSCISFCAFCLLMYRPATLFSAGFQLSFLAVLTISIVMPHGDRIASYGRKTAFTENDSHEKPGKGPSLPRRIAGWRSQAYGIFLMQAGIMPMTLRQFHYISPAAFFLNPPAIALAGLIVPAGVVMMPFSVLKEWEFLPEAVRFAADGGFRLLCMMEDMLLSVLTFLNRLPENTPLDYRYAASPPSGIFLFYYAVLFFFCSEAGGAFLSGFQESGQKSRNTARDAAAAQAFRNGQWPAEKENGRRDPVERRVRFFRTVCLLSVFAAVCSAAGLCMDRASRAGDLVFLDVGQGDCAHLRDGGTNIIFDSGGSDTYDVGENILIPYFLANGVSELDLAVISHLHTDHCGGLISLTKGVRIKKMMLSAVYQPNADEIAGAYGIPAEDLLFVRAGDSIAVGGITIDVLAPAAADRETYQKILEDSEDENELCLIVKAKCRGTEVLFTGDIGAEYEKKLTSLYGNGLAADILKVAHHGSRYSTCSRFLSAVSPSSAVIQVGTNYYGHPSGEILGRLEDFGTQIFRNDRDGAVFFDLKSGGKVTSMSRMRRDFFRE